MLLRRTFRFIPLFLPVIGFLLIAASPHCAGRLSLMLHGLPFARVTKDEVLNYVHTDSMRNAGIVISDGAAVGWIYQPMFGFARFVRFNGTPNLDPPDNSLWLDFFLVRIWHLRWWLLPVQVVVVILWLRMREKRVQYSTP